MIKESKILDLAFENGTPLIIIDHNQIKENLETFRKNLPRVKPYYAIKANPEPEILPRGYDYLRPRFRNVQVHKANLNH